MMRRCNRFLVGAQRSGTTALKYYLDQHPDILTGKGKEIHFYDRWYAASPTMFLRDSLYRKKFPRTASGHLMDVSPSYIFLPNAIERLARDRPDARIIVLLRSPVARAVSQWKLEYQRGNEDLNFSRAIRRPKSEQDLRHHSYLQRGIYDNQIRRLWKACGREGVLVLRAEDFRYNTESTLEKVWTHLGVQPIDVRPPISPVHASEYEFTPNLDDVTYMLNYYARSISEVQELLGWDLTSWADPGLAAKL